MTLRTAPQPNGKHASPPIVGIGASAAGIDALNRFFGCMPADSGLAFVVVLHLDPRHHSELASILSRRTTMPVADIVDGVRIEPNVVYVIVPDKSLRVEGDQLRLSEPAEPRGHRHPVDVFFVSLAEHRRERAIAIVLSGTGRNGTQGMKEVKASGGLALVQDPATAQFDGMPRSAVTAGLADYVIAPEKMPEILLRYAWHGYMADPDGLAAKALGAQSVLDPVLALLRARSGHDFRIYKRGTLQRCIHLAGLSRCSAHGLRKAAARRVAEAGCTEHEIAAITGHASLREIVRCTKAADQKKLARAAIDKVSSPKGQQKLSNLHDGLTIRAKNQTNSR